MKKVVVIGGGTGLSSMLKGMKKIDTVDLTAIVTVADDGGSTGRIRDIYNVPAVGDIRHVMAAMADEGDETFFSDLLNYRFEGDEDVGGHNLGNLIFLAMINTTGSFMGAIQSMSRVLNVKGKILPSTLDVVTLYAMMKDGTLVRGEANIPKVENSIDHVFYRQRVHAYSQAIKAIQEADLIIYGIGSLYTSIMPNLIIPDISRAIQANPCKKIYFCNAMSQPGETDGYTVQDHIRAIEKHSFTDPVDIVVVNHSLLPRDVLEAYKKEGSFPIEIGKETTKYDIIQRDLLSLDEKRHIRHNPDAVKQVVEELLSAV